MAAPVLLVADDLATIAAVRRLVGKEGYELILATSAADALIAFGHHLPGVVLLDPKVESERGGVVLEELQSHPDAGLAKVLLLGESVPGFAWPVVPLPPDAATFVPMLEDAMRGGPQAEGWTVPGAPALSADAEAAPRKPVEPDAWRATAPKPPGLTPIASLDPTFGAVLDDSPQPDAHPPPHEEQGGPPLERAIALAAAARLQARESALAREAAQVELAQTAQRLQEEKELERAENQKSLALVERLRGELADEKGRGGEARIAAEREHFQGLLAEKDRALEQAERDLEALRDEAMQTGKSTEKRADELQKMARAMEAELERVKKERDAARADVARAGEIAAKLSAAEETTQKLQETLRSERERAQAAVGRSSDENSGLQRLVAQLEDALEAQKKLHEESVAKRSELEATLATTLKHAEELENRAHELETRWKEASAETGRTGEGLHRATEENARLHEVSVSLRKEREAALGEKDRLSGELSKVTAERDHLTASLAHLTAEKEQLAGQVAQGSESGERLAAEKDALTRERDRLLAEKDELTIERDLFAEERGKLTAEKDRLAAERDQLTAERDLFAEERGTLSAEKDRLAAERDQLIAERDQRAFERDQHVAERDQHAASVSQLAGDKAQLAAEKEELAAEVDRLRKQNADVVDAASRAQAEAVRLASEQAALAGQSAALTSENAGLTAELAALKQGRTEAQREVEALRDEVRKLEARAAAAESQAASLEEKLAMPVKVAGRTALMVPRAATVDRERLAELVCQLVLGRNEVKLELGTADGLRSLWLSRGALVAAESSHAGESLIERARKDGLIDARQESELRMLRLASAREVLEVLRSRGFLRQAESKPLVQRYVEQVALDALSEGNVGYRVSEESAGPEVLGLETPRPLLPLLAEALRRGLAPEALLELLGGGEAIPVARESSLDLRSLGFTEKERRLLGLVDGQATVEELSMVAGVKPEAAFRALLVARYLGLVEVRPPAGQGAVMDPELDVKRLLAKFEEVQEADYFTILGLGRGAGTDEVQRSFERLSREFDPIRFSGHPDARLQQQAQIVYRLLEEAARALEDDRRRVEYARHLLD